MIASKENNKMNFGQRNPENQITGLAETQIMAKTLFPERRGTPILWQLLSRGICYKLLYIFVALS